MAQQTIQLTVSEKIGFFWVLLSTPIKIIGAALHHAILPPKDSPGIGRSVATTFIRGLSSLTQRQMKGMLPTRPTSTVIKQYCAKRKLSFEIDSLPSGASLFWLGSRPQKDGKVLLYVYGGGYNIAADPNHILFASKCALRAKATLAILEYTLAPEGRFPTQLIEAVKALKQILTYTLPSNVLIVGDSAGAHLILSLMSHLNHPSKDIETLTLSEKLGGICVTSPVLSFNYNKKSYEYNADRDYLSLRQMKEFNSYFKPLGMTDEEAIKDPRLSPLDAPKGWWKNCPVDRILLTMGEWEVFLDDCKEFGERLKEEAAATSKVDVVLGRREVHGPCVMDAFLGYEDGDSTAAVLAWMSV